MAASETIVQARSIVAAGELDPETIVTPGIFVRKVVEVDEPVQEEDLARDGATYPMES